MQRMFVADISAEVEHIDKNLQLEESKAQGLLSVSSKTPKIVNWVLKSEKYELHLIDMTVKMFFLLEDPQTTSVKNHSKVDALQKIGDEIVLQYYRFENDMPFIYIFPVDNWVSIQKRMLSKKWLQRSNNLAF